MRKLILICVLILGFVYNSYGQNAVNQSRMLRHSTYLNELNDENIGGKKQIPSNSKFTITGTKDQYYKVYFWNWSENSERINTLEERGKNKSPKENAELNKLKEENRKYKELNFDVANKEQRYFLIPIEKIDETSIPIYKKWSSTIGALTFPFKYRFNNNDFEPSFNMNAVGGVKWNPAYVGNHTFSLLFGVGASSVRLKTKNINTTTSLQNEIDAAAITFSMNLVYEFKPLQIGISTGIDNVFNNTQYNWSNQGKPWLSLAIGINVFTNDEPANETKQ